MIERVRVRACFSAETPRARPAVMCFASLTKRSGQSPTGRGTSRSFAGGASCQYMSSVFVSTK